MSASITITAELRSSTDKGFALFTGETHEVVDERSGEIVERDHYHWVARKLSTIEREWRGREGQRMVEIALPEWLAKREGLI